MQKKKVIKYGFIRAETPCLCKPLSGLSANTLSMLVGLEDHSASL